MSSRTVERPHSDPNYHLRNRFYPNIYEYAQSCNGILLDVGCGSRPYEHWFSNITKYIGIDVTSAGKNPTFLGSATNLPIAENSVDHVFSAQVLEHVPDPIAFFVELKRVLKPGGTAFVSTNQMYPLHEYPNDYYRFTRYGLCTLASRADLTSEATFEIGSLVMRACSELNYVIDHHLKDQIANLCITTINTLATPFVDLSPREEYIIVGVELSN